MIRIKGLIVFLMISISLNGQLIIENIATTTRIYDIQEYKDFVWIATDGGIYKCDYNGNIIERIIANESVLSNRVYDIYKDMDENIWFATENGISKYDNGVWSNISRNNSELPISTISEMALDIDGNIWAATPYNGLLKFDGNEWVTYKTSDGLSHNFTRCLCVDADNKVWIGTADGLNMFDGINWTTYSITDGLGSNAITDIICDLDNNIWIATNGGVSKFKDNVWEHYNIDNGLLSNVVVSISVSEVGDVVFGSPEGISVYSNNNWSVFTTTESASCCYVDKNKNYWFGSEQLFLKEEDSIKEILLDKNLITNYIFDVYHAANNQVFIGTWSGLSIKENDTYYTHLNDPFTYQVREILNDPVIQDCYWLATSNGVWKFENNETTRLDGFNGGSRIDDIYIDCNNRKWFSTYGSGVYCLDGEQLLNYTDTDGLPSSYCSCVYVDKNGIVWISTYDGFGKYVNGVFTFEYLPGELEEIFPGHEEYYPIGVSKIMKDPNNDDIWLATGKGLMKKSGDSYILIGEEHGLPTNVKDFEFDKNGKIWIATWQGLYYYDFENFKHYNVENGLASNNLMSVSIDNDDNIWAATWYGGINVLYKDNISTGVFSNIINSEDFEVFPNPSNGYFNLTYKLGDFQEGYIEVFSMTGSKILFQSITSDNSYINLNGHSKGIYICKVIIDGRTYVKKLSLE